ncbi:GNAT family N-acetyltransferase [Flammeovirga kamogawensis]|uniref:GNAT family N-acetyltransferase n=1 Tax=Flammeovirga kamogawensis TaxID=373891 RepID=A0ABX8H2Q8_9BACT|nr:GNAT family protein [Flammeovirga kamogawensis]MBB6460136.1 RimJ/RimL family protein N-acetyltransferase [Flammeovirga kamogawensis]QWG09949.1 GNAT family N-acetyltransferase [Flammeovirga kamogawensis]TRX65457.1 GNAT family N-acetyltransferase [Flammeovirga kamogawensis]
MKTSVRELISSDISLIADYWLKSDHTYLTSLGVDISKLPRRKDLVDMIENQLVLSYKEKKNYALIWEIDGEAIGHSNINSIKYGHSANMHLHIWKTDLRRKGAGVELVEKSLPFYFNNFDLDVLNCSPSAENDAPNKTLEKIGFTFIKKHITIPGSLNFKQEVNHWEIRKNDFLKLTI